MYFIYDIDGCAYMDSIKITNSPLKRGYEYLIAKCNSAHEANEKASHYLYDINRQVDVSNNQEYYNEIGGYPPYNEFEDFIKFINEDEDDDYEDDDYDDDDEDDDYEDYDYDDDYEDDDYEDDDYDDDEEEEW